MKDTYLERPWLKHYDPHVQPTLKYEQETFCERFAAAAARYADKPALVYVDKALTFRELDQWSNRLAHYLVQTGLRPGDVVGLNMPNVPAHYLAVIAVQKAGCISTGLSPLLTAAELEHQLNDSGAKAVLTLDILYDKIYTVAPKTQVRSVLVASIADFLPPLKAYLGKLLKKIPQAPIPPLNAGVQVERFLKAVRPMPTNEVRVERGLDEPMYMMYTGGTTGPSKGALLTQRNVMSNAKQIVTWLNLSPADTFLCAFPLFHIAGLCLGTVSMTYGITQIAVPNPRDAAFLVGAIKKHRPTALVNVTTIYLELMKQPEFRSLDFSGIQWCMSAASPFPPDNIKDFESIVGQGKLIELYGMTETSPVTCCLPRFGTKKPGSIGMPLPDTTFRLIDPDTQAPVPLGETGEIAIHGPQVFSLGYFNKPEETRHALREGWMFTGDIARMDEDGYFYIVDRLKDMVNVSGFKVFTRELDDVLAGHPDIETAATFGIPDLERPGSERVACAVVLKHGIADGDAEREKIMAYLKERVAPFKVPRTLIFMDELPMSGVGKVLKRELRQMVSARQA